MRYASLALIFVGTLLAGSSPGGSIAEAAQINIFSGSSPVFAPVFIADAQGFFKEEKLDVSVRPFTSGAEATEGFRSGAGQFLVAGDVPMLYLLPGGDVVLLAQFSANEDMLLIMGDKAIKSASDFRGKKVGLVRKSASEYLLHNYLRRANLTLEDVKLVHLAPFDQVPALVRGDVDALSTWKPFDRKIAGLGGDKFRTISWNGQENYVLYSGIVAKRSFVAANQKDVQGVIRALKKASDWMEATDPKTVSEVLGRYLKTSPADVAYVIARNSWKMVDDAAFRGVMQDIERFLLAQGLIPRKVNWTEARDLSFLRAIDPSMVQGQ